MARPRVQRHHAPGTWCLDLLLAVMLLAASVAWAGLLTGDPVGVDLMLAGSCLVAAAAFALRGVAGWRREHRRTRARAHR